MLIERSQSRKLTVDLSNVGAIVVAERNATASLLTGQLRALKFGAVHSFANGVEAIDQLTMPPRMSANILILEWAGGAQAEFLKRLRRVPQRHVQEIPAIAVMLQTDMKAVIMARDAGANAVLAWPISTSQLIEKVSWVVSSDVPFVRDETYVGPDRRRFQGFDYHGEERRQDVPIPSEPS